MKVTITHVKSSRSKKNTSPVGNYFERCEDPLYASDGQYININIATTDISYCIDIVFY